MTDATADQRSHPSDLPAHAPPAPAEARNALLRDDSVLFRIIVSLIASETEQRRGSSFRPADWHKWTPETAIDEDGIGFDSLSRLELVARISRFFCLNRSGVEDYLVVRRRLGEWVEVVRAGLEKLPANDPVPLGFDTSGSTGRPRSHLHMLADLAAETAVHATMLPHVQRVVSLVPPHHLYGFLWTVLGPSERSIPVVEMRKAGPGSVARKSGQGDLLVATPFQWSAIASIGTRFPPGCLAVLSGGPSTPALWQELGDLGLDASLEIYGSTETAGVASREAPHDPFSLFPHLREPSGSHGTICRNDGRPLAQLPDHVRWEAPRRFHLEGRRDARISIGGILVDPATVRAKLTGLDGVADCSIRPAAAGDNARLKAFVVPAETEVLENSAQLALLEAGLRKYCNASMTAAERPASFRFGAAIPRDAMGKNTDWDVG